MSGVVRSDVAPSNIMGTFSTFLLVSHCFNVIVEQYFDSTTYGLITRYGHEALPPGLSISYTLLSFMLLTPSFLVRFRETHSAPTTNIEDSDYF